MEATYKTSNGKLTFRITGEDVKTIFKQIATVQEVFDSENECGCCHSSDIRLLARKVEDYDFYELACQAQGCHARFSFGQAKKGGALFPKRKDEDGKWLPNRGWLKWDKPNENAPADQSGSRATPAAAPKKDGVPVYDTWEAASSGPHWGQDWLSVGGTLYKLNADREYAEVKRTQ